MLYSVPIICLEYERIYCHNVPIICLEYGRIYLFIPIICLDMGEFIAIMFPSAGEAISKLSKSFPNIDQVKVRITLNGDQHF